VTFHVFAHLVGVIIEFLSFVLNNWFFETEFVVNGDLGEDVKNLNNSFSITRLKLTGGHVKLNIELF